MAFITADAVSEVAVALLARSLVLPNTVLRVDSALSSPSGGTAILRVPSPRTARVQATPNAPITFDPILETEVPVSVSHLYDATRVSDEAMTYEVTDFVTQVSMPQLESVARAAETLLATIMNGLALEVPVTGYSDVDDAVLQAMAALDNEGVPQDNRWLAVSPDFARYLLRSDVLVAFAGATQQSALDNAVIGTYRGFNVVKTPALTGTKAVAYHESAFAFGNITPSTARIPGADVSVSTQGGVSLRQTIDYDSNTLSRRSVVSTFAGAALVDADRVVVIGEADES